MKTYAYGFPRLGADREFKKTIEDFWKGKTTEAQVLTTLSMIQRDNLSRYQDTVDQFPCAEISPYDPMLDTAILVGLFNPKDLKSYYELCRGSQALEMTKWFNTNYHYLVTDFSQLKGKKFFANTDHFISKFKHGRQPAFIGPFTFLKLSKGLTKFGFEKLFLDLVKVYKTIIDQFPSVQIDEPAFVLDLTEKEIKLIEKGYKILGTSKTRISLITYYDSVEWLDRLFKLPVSAIGLDAVRGEKQLETILKNGFPQDKELIVGLVDGRNVWKTDISHAIGWLKKLSVVVKNLALSNAGPLYHLPISLERETKLPAELKERLSFAEEKLQEIKNIAEIFNNKAPVPKVSLSTYGKNAAVQKRIAALKPADFKKKVGLAERRKLQERLLNLPEFPTTTIGSYPQTAEVRAQRSAFRSGKLSSAQYDQYIHGEIDKLIDFQEKLGLDVLVHGEFERTDMVEFFAQKLDGIATTENGWIISYGTRAYRPPMIFGDVSRPEPMTVKEIVYAQSKTNKPMKGMLTGAVTIIAWSFVREDIPIADVAYQIGLSLRDEIKDYEKAGIKIVQVDEAAFRERAPIKHSQWKSYFDWAVKSFNLTTNTQPETQIHTHMCYSEFGEIIDAINAMDFDVISIEATRSKGDIISHFEKAGFKRQIGLGVWDIHSPAIPTTDRMLSIVKRSLQKIPKRNFWLNPDCGLKTRDWPETEKALQNLITVAQKLRR